MNSQSNRPLTKFAGSERGDAALSVVLNKKPVMHVNSIQSKDMIDSQRLTDEPAVLSTFTVSDYILNILFIFIYTLYTISNIKYYIQLGSNKF